MNAATEHVRAGLELERLTKAAAQYEADGPQHRSTKLRTSRPP